MNLPFEEGPMPDFDVFPDEMPVLNLETKTPTVGDALY